MTDKKILVVEDSKLAQIIVKSILIKLNYQVDIVSSGEEAVEYCMHTPYCLVFMDIGLPGMDGLCATQAIRQNGNQMPIVALTAHDDKQLNTEAIAVGMNDYLIKPLTLVAAKHIIDKYLSA